MGVPKPFTAYLQLKVLTLAELTPDNAFQLMQAVGGDISFSASRGGRNSDGTTLSVRSMRRDYGQWLNQSGDVVTEPHDHGHLPVVLLDDDDTISDVLVRFRQEHS